MGPWCPVCCTRHIPERACPRERELTGVEFTGYKVNVETPQGMRAFGVLLGEAGRTWRARIITFPKILWTIPGGGGTMKFLGPTSEDVELQATNYIREHCATRGYTMRDQVQLVQLELRDSREFGDSAERYSRILPLRYGVNKPTLIGQTGNLSATGLFVHTKLPIPHGAQAGMLLELEHCRLPLRGTVAWSRDVPGPAQPSGMGLHLIRPPAVYLEYIHALAAGTDDAGVPSEDLAEHIEALSHGRRQRPPG